MKLIHTDCNGDTHEVSIGYSFGHGPDTLEVIWCPEPHKPSSSGKVICNVVGESLGSFSNGEYFAQVFDMEWIEREDQGWVDPEIELIKVLALLQELNYGDMSGDSISDIADTVMSVTMGECMLISPDETKFLHDWGHKEHIPEMLKKQS